LKLILKKIYQSVKLKMTGVEEVKIAVICNDMEYVKKTLEKIDRRLELDYITKTEFEPIKKIVYGLVMLVLTAVVGAIVSLVLK